MRSDVTAPTAPTAHAVTIEGDIQAILAAARAACAPALLRAAPLYRKLPEHEQARFASWGAREFLAYQLRRIPTKAPRGRITAARQGRVVRARRRRTSRDPPPDPDPDDDDLDGALRAAVECDDARDERRAAG